MPERSHTRPLIVGVRQLAFWSRTKTVEEAMLDLGFNSGNMIFTEALVRVIEDAVWCSFALTEEDLEGRDCIVLAAANWINSYDDFGWLSAKLESSNLPVYVFGLGAQSSLSHEPPVLKEGTLRMLEVIKERSVCIGTRGDFSCEILDDLGIKNTASVGCPSLMLAGPSGPVIRDKGLIDENSVCFQGTRHLFGNCDSTQQFLYRQAYKRNIDIILQSELADIYFALDRLSNSDITSRASQAILSCYGFDGLVSPTSFLREKGHIYFQIDPWMEFLKTKSFCFGSRIHGVIAALISGTAAVLVAHDARTLEMAKCMAIPYILSAEIETGKDIDLVEVANLCDVDILKASYPVYYRRLVDVMVSNGLKISSDFLIPT